MQVLLTAMKATKVWLYFGIIRPVNQHGFDSKNWRTWAGVIGENPLALRA